jgi:5'-nucleotidase
VRLLCTNDDGILALGLDCLVRAVQSLGEVTVVAPDREQSATSHSLTMHHPLRVKPRGEGRFQVDGTPTDCVMLAVEALMPSRPDFVLSGINHGQNMGEDVLYSGTVAPAQIPTVSHLLAHIFSLRLPSDTLLNINLPSREARGVRLTRLGRRVFSDPLRRMQDPWGKEVYWIGGGVMAWTGGPDSDYQAIEDGYVSVTPLHLDLTHYDMLASAADWWREP